MSWSHFNKTFFTSSLMNKLERLPVVGACRAEQQSVRIILTGANTLAYFRPTSVTKEKKFVVFAAARIYCGDTSYTTTC
jgi:hypothetical protein